MTIYKITNTVNNKIYIGQTIQTLKRRFQHHCTSKDEMPFHRAIQKHGKENFIVEELCSVTNLDDLNSLEVVYIKKYNSLVPNGYNVALGGTGSTMTGRHHSKETKKKMSLAALGRTFSQETKNKMSTAKIGTKQSNDIIEKRSKAQTGMKYATKEVVCNETGERFISVLEASRQTGIYRTKIVRQLTGKVKKTKCPFTFRYIE